MGQRKGYKAFMWRGRGPGGVFANDWEKSETEEGVSGWKKTSIAHATSYMGAVPRNKRKGK